MRAFFRALIVIVVFSACSRRPSNRDIERKILLEYICKETARIQNLKILSSKDSESATGSKGLQFEVSGEVEWPKGCTEFGTGLPPGYKEKFENKIIYLVETDNGWQ